MNATEILLIIAILILAYDVFLRNKKTNWLSASDLSSIQTPVVFHDDKGNFVMSVDNDGIVHVNKLSIGTTVFSYEPAKNVIQNNNVVTIKRS